MPGVNPISSKFVIIIYYGVFPGAKDFMIPAEMNSNADWAKLVATLFGNHIVNQTAKITFLS
jgi:hypothetical protein